MKQSCIQHPPNDRQAIARPSYVKLCGGNHCAAFCLGALELHVRHIGIPLPYYLTYEAFVPALTGLYRPVAIQRALPMLELQGFLGSYKMTPRQAAMLCKGKRPQHMPGMSHVCQWCESTTALLQQHHFPNTNAQGGTACVGICGSCHAEYHWLIGSTFFRPLPFLDQWIAAHPLSSDDAMQLGVTYASV